MINTWRKKALPILLKSLTKQKLGQWIKTPHASWNIKVSRNLEYLVVSNQCYEKCRGERRLYREIRNQPLQHMNFNRAEIRYLWNGEIKKRPKPPVGPLLACLRTCGRKFERIWGSWK